MSPTKTAAKKAPAKRPTKAPAPKGAVVHPVPAFREAMDGARPTLEDFARAADVPMGTLLSYYSGTRRAPEHVRRAVALYLRQLARRMDELADHLTPPPTETSA